MADPDKIGHGANYDGYGIDENGIDYGVDDLDSEFYEYDEERPHTDDEYIPGQFTNEAADELAFQEELAQKEAARHKKRGKASISSINSKNTTIQDILPVEIEEEEKSEPKVNRPAGALWDDLRELNDWTLADIVNAEKISPEDRQNATAEIARRKRAGIYDIKNASHDILKDLGSHGYAVSNGKILYPTAEYKSYLKDKSKPHPNGVVRESIAERLEKQQKTIEARKENTAKEKKESAEANVEAAIKEFEDRPTIEKIPHPEREFTEKQIADRERDESKREREEAIDEDRKLKEVLNRETKFHDNKKKDIAEKEANARAFNMPNTEEKYEDEAEEYYYDDDITLGDLVEEGEGIKIGDLIGSESEPDNHIRKLLDDEQNDALKKRAERMAREMYAEQTSDELKQLEAEKKKNPNNEKIRRYIEETKELLDKILSELEITDQSSGNTSKEVENVISPVVERPSYYNSQGQRFRTREEAINSETEHWSRNNN